MDKCWNAWKLSVIYIQPRAVTTALYFADEISEMSSIPFFVKKLQEVIMNMFCISAVNCKSLNLDHNVKSSIKLPSFHDRVTLTCKEGYFAMPIYITCDAHGNWPSDRPNCTGEFKC